MIRLCKITRAMLRLVWPLISSLVMSMMISGGLVVCPAGIVLAASSHPPVRPCAISSHAVDDHGQQPLRHRVGSRRCRQMRRDDWRSSGSRRVRDEDASSSSDSTQSTAECRDLWRGAREFPPWSPAVGHRVVPALRYARLSLFSCYDRGEWP